MEGPKVSVIIPTYGGQDHLADAIQSVVAQSYSNLELLIVDDASPSDPAAIVGRFADSRIRMIRHEYNRGAVAARRTGIAASIGDIIALLDQDDLFHVDKLRTHVRFLQSAPECGVSYNARFEFVGSVDTIVDVYQPAPALGLEDLVSGFPISPSDTVIARKWALHDDIWDDSFATQAEHVIFNGQEIVFGGRLALRGCRFLNVGRALNYRRLDPSRRQKHLQARCRAELACQKIIFDDPLCPSGLRDLEPTAHSNILLMWAHTAYVQGDNALGEQLLNQLIDLRPSLSTGSPSDLIKTLICWIGLGSIQTQDRREEVVHAIFDHLPEPLCQQEPHRSWAVAACRVLTGIQHSIWGRHDEAALAFAHAVAAGSQLDDTIGQALIGEVLDYEKEFGVSSGVHVLDTVSRYLTRTTSRARLRAIRAEYDMNQAHRLYQAGDYRAAPRSVVRAIIGHRRFATDRGALAVLAHSLVRQMKAQLTATATRRQSQ